jgi:hypothetical protein
MSDLDQVMGNIYPFIYPDFELISVLEKITKRGNKVQFRKLMGISYVINKVRSAEAFNAQIVIDESDIEGIPEGFRKSTDKALQVRAHLNKAISDGLGLTIPVDIGLEKYIELARDFQPQIAKIVGNVVKNSNAVNRTSAASAMHKEIMKINGEIERIKGLKRHMLLESAAEFYSNNRALASTAFIAGGLGLAGGLTGCLGGVAVGIARNFAKKKGWVGKNKGMDRFGRAVHLDLQPYMDRLVAKYVGSYVPAINVLSLRKKIADSVAA